MSGMGMTAGLRFCIAAAAALIAFAQAPALAQEAPTTNTPATDAIGPRELEDFSLNGTVTRPAEAPPAATPRPAPPAASRTDQTASPVPSQVGPAATAPVRERAVAQASGDAPARQPAVRVTLPPADALSDAPTAAPLEASPPPAEEGGFAAPAPTAAIPGGHSNVLPWLLALGLLGAGAGYYFWRQRATPSYAAAGAASRFVPPEPAQTPSPPQRSPQPRAPTAPPAGPAGLVSTRLRPWLDIEFAPARCVVEDDKATIDFDIVVTNTGSTPARDVLIEASLFNAGPAQDQEIGGFFAHPVAKGDRIPAIPPLKKVALKSAVSLTREQMRQFEVAGRRLFVPLIGFNALYRWSGGDGQTSASYLLGRDTKAEKLAPFRLDLGPRIFRGLGAREHQLRVRR